MNSGRALPPAPDSGWSYMVLVGATLAMISRAWTIRGNGILYQQLMEKYGKSASETALTFVVVAIFRTIGGPVASMSCGRFGVRNTMAASTLMSFAAMLGTAFSPNIYLVYFTYGAVLGLTITTAEVSTFIILGQYFNKKRAMAFGIASAAVAGSNLVLMPVFTILFPSYGYSGSLLILAAIFLHGFISSLLYRPLQMQKSQHSEKELGFVITENGSAILEDDTEMQKDHEIILPDDVKHSSIQKSSNFGSTLNKLLNLELLKIKEVLGLNLLTFFATFSSVMLLTFMVAYIKERNISTEILAIYFTVDCTLAMVSAVVTGFVYDITWIKLRRFIFYGIGFGCSTFCLALIPFMPNTVSFIIICGTTTIFAVQVDSQQTTVLGDLVEPMQLPAAIGQNRFFRGLGGVLAPLVGGLLKDWSGKYESCLYFAVGTMTIGFLCFVIGNYNKLVKQCYFSSEQSRKN